MRGDSQGIDGTIGFRREEPTSEGSRWASVSTLAAAVFLSFGLSACSGVGTELDGGSAGGGASDGGDDPEGPQGGGDDGEEGGGGGGDDDPVDPGDPPGGPSEEPEDEHVDPPPDGSTVAVLELDAPQEDRFLLRATIPVLRDTFPRSDGQNPFAVVGPDGVPVASQCEIVSRWPDDDDGADVVEVLARVDRPNGASPGDRIRYDVVLSPHEVPDRPSDPSVADLSSATLNVPSAIQALIDDPTSIEIRARDCFGHTYTMHPMAEPDPRLLRYGYAQSQIRSYAPMLPDAPVSGNQGTLPHLFGVHAFLATVSGDPVLKMDLRFHNGFDGRNQSTELDDPLDHFYFESIEILLPGGYVLQQAFPDPMLGTIGSDGDKLVYPLVEPLSNGRMHVMPHQFQFHRRLVVAPSDVTPKARAVLQEQGLAFCVRGTDPDGGHEYYSWWNDATDRYFPQRALLPSLEHVGLNGIRNVLLDDLEDTMDVLASGQKTGYYPFEEDRLGWAHPWGVGYGGMTGGDEIWFFDGVETVCSASRDGYRWHQASHRMNTDRQSSALYQLNGDPSSVESWLHTDGGGNSYVPFNFYITEINDNGDPMGVNDAPDFQVDYVKANGLDPSYENTLKGFAPHDFQHYNRYTRNAKTLTWLGNDALAREDLRHSAEIFHLSFHQHNNNQWGGSQGSGLQSMIENIADEPGIGSGMGRGEGWGGDSMSAAYSTGTIAWRNDKREWFELMLLDALAEGQADCTGFYQSFVIIKALDGQESVRQAIEQYILENMVRGVMRSVFQDAQPALYEEARLSAVASHYSSISELAWTPGQSGPWNWTAVADSDDDSIVYCTLADMPADWHETENELHLLWSSHAYAWETTGDYGFFEKLEDETYGGEDALENLLEQGLSNIENKAGLIARLQKLAGDI